MSSSVSEPEVLEMDKLSSAPKPVSPEVIPIFREGTVWAPSKVEVCKSLYDLLCENFNDKSLPDIDHYRQYLIDQLDCTDAEALNIIDQHIASVLEDNLPHLRERQIEREVNFAIDFSKSIRDERFRKQVQAELKAMLAALNGAGVSKSFDDSNSDKEIYGEEWQSEALEAAVKDTFLEGCLTLIEGTFKRDDAGKLRYDLQYNDPIGNRAIFQYREDEDGAYLTLKSGASAQQIRAFVETIPIAFEDFIDPARATAFAFCQDQILKGLDKKTLKTIFDGMPRVTIWLESGFDQAFYENRIRQLLSHGILPELRESCQCKELADAHKAVLMTDGEWDLQEICKYYIDMSKAFIKALEAQSSENDEIPMDFKQKHEMLMKEIEALGEHSDIQGGLDISPAPAPL